jgi:hypothetical protein
LFAGTVTDADSAGGRAPVSRRADSGRAPDVAAWTPAERRRHDGVAAGAAIVAIGEHRLDEVLLALAGEARDLLAPAVVREMTAPAVVLLREREPLLGERCVGRPVRDRPRRLRGVVLGKADDLLVGQAVHGSLHLRRDAQLLAEQDELRLEEELPAARRSRASAICETPPQPWHASQSGSRSGPPTRKQKGR